VIIQSLVILISEEEKLSHSGLILSLCLRHNVSYTVLLVFCVCFQWVLFIVLRYTRSCV